MNSVTDFKPGDRVRITNLQWDASLLGKFGIVLEWPDNPGTYVDVAVDNLEGTHYEQYIGQGMLFRPHELTKE